MADIMEKTATKFRVVLVDDERAWTDKIAAEIRGVFAALTDECQVFCHNNAKWFLMDYREGTRADVRGDLYLLDVAMPEVDGFKLAETIRRWEPEAPIVFLTNEAMSIGRGYDVEAKGYFLKGDAPERWQVKLTQIYESWRVRREWQMRREDCYCYSQGSLTRMLVFSDIVSFEYDGLKKLLTTTLTTGEMLTERKSLTQLMEEVAAGDFVRISGYMAVNAIYIREMDRGEIRLKNGRCLAVSRSYAKDVRRKLEELGTGKRSCREN